MSIDNATVARIAALARIRVPEADRERLAGELRNIVAWIEQLSEVDTDGVEPMTSVVDMKTPIRNDAVTDGDCVDKILANAPNAAHGFSPCPRSSNR